MLNIWISWLLEQATTLVNQLVIEINRLPYSVVGDIYMNKWQVGLWYDVVGSILVFCYTKTFRSFVFVSLLIFFLAMSNIKIVLQQRSQQEVVFYSVYPRKVVAFVQGEPGWLLVDKALQEDAERFNYQIKPNLLAMGIDHYSSYKFNEAIHSSRLPWQECQDVKVGYWGGKRLIMIDQFGIQWPLWDKIFTDYLTIEGNSVHSLESLLTQFECGTLVIGSSNRKRLAAQLYLEAKQLQINSRHLCEQGALQVGW